MSDGPLPWIGADDIGGRMSFAVATDALEAALRGGLDPAAGPGRTVVGTAHGQLLLMPAEDSRALGVKLVTVGAGDAAAGVPRVHGVYLLFDPVTLAPTTLLDGAALTTLRTPAMSAMAVRHLAAAGARTLVVFGTGPQARGHIEAVRAVRPVSEVVVVGRDGGRTEAFVAALVGAGVHAVVGTPAAVADAEIVVCATTAVDPVVDGRLVADGACVVAVGSHEPHARELDDQLMGRALVVVEDIGTAMREAGDVVQAVGHGALDVDDLVPLADLVRGRVQLPSGRPRVFKSVGMAWQDLVVAAALQAVPPPSAGSEPGAPVSSVGA